MDSGLKKIFQMEIKYVNKYKDNAIIVFLTYFDNFGKFQLKKTSFFIKG